MNSIGSPPSVSAGINVMVVGEYRLFVECLAGLLTIQSDIEVVGVAFSSDQALTLAEEVTPSVVVIDHQVPGIDGIALGGAMRRAHPDTMVVVLTGSSDDLLLGPAILAGCSVVLTKRCTSEELLTSVHRAALGDVRLSQRQLKELLRDRAGADRGALPVLTARQRGILARIASGKTNKVVADELNLSVNTVRNHVQTILRQLDAHSKLEAVAIALRAGLIDAPLPTT